MASEEMGVYIGRIFYWSHILNIDEILFYDLADEDKPASNDLDAWVKSKYAEELKSPEVMARLLASRSE